MVNAVNAMNANSKTNLVAGRLEKKVLILLKIPVLRMCQMIKVICVHTHTNDKLKNGIREVGSGKTKSQKI